MDELNLIRTVVTLLSLALFIGIAWWAYAPCNRARFDDASRLPFDAVEDK